METEAQIIAWSDQQNAWQRDTIRRHGWAVTAVFGDELGEYFAYTVGLSGFEHPELLVTGMPPEVAGRLLNEYGERVKAGQRLRPGDQRLDAIARRPVELLEVTDSRQAEMLDANGWYAEPDGPPVPALQLVWSDPAGLLPWEPGYSLASHLQPLHGTPVQGVGR